LADVLSAGKRRPRPSGTSRTERAPDTRWRSPPPPNASPAPEHNDLHAAFQCFTLVVGNETSCPAVGESPIALVDFCLLDRACTLLTNYGLSAPSCKPRPLLPNCASPGAVAFDRLFRARPDPKVSIRSEPADATPPPMGEPRPAESGRDERAPASSPVARNRRVSCSTRWRAYRAARRADRAVLASLSEAIVLQSCMTVRRQLQNVVTARERDRGSRR
jgi:hypothetical protein